VVTIGASDLKERLNEIVRRVEDGDYFTVTRHGRPVALLQPYCGVENDKGSSDGWVASVLSPALLHTGILADPDAWRVYGYLLLEVVKASRQLSWAVAESLESNQIRVVVLKMAESCGYHPKLFREVLERLREKGLLVVNSDTPKRGLLVTLLLPTLRRGDAD